MAILDNRTIYDSAESTTGWVDTSGGATGFALDTELAMQGTYALSTSYTSTSSELGCLHNNGSAADRSNTVWYLWFNFLAPGALDTEVNGGVTVRFCGATITDFFEIEVAGSNTYAGGPIQFVVDIEEASANPFATGGTPPDPNAIQYVGVVVNPLVSMPKMADNYAIDEIAFVLATDPAIVVEGQNTGAVDWTWDDVVSTAEAASWGTCKRAPGGGVVLSGPVRFGANDAVTHGFSDTNQVILWADELVPDGFYFLEVVGGSGAQSFVAGVKTGTGDDATGGQGWVISAAGPGDRWDFKCNDANIDAANLYGCTFLHGGAFSLDNAFTSVVSCSFVDCSSATITDCADFLGCNIIDANTADDVGFVTTNDITDLVNCSFTFSDGHAVTLTTPNVSAQTSTSNRFIGYGATASTDSAIYNNSGAGLVTISLAGTSTLGEHTYKNGASASTSITASVPVSFEAVDKAGAAIQDVLVSVYLTADDSEVLNAVTLASGFITTTFSGATPADFYYRYRKSTGPATRYKNLSGAGTIASSTGSTIKRTMTVDNVADPN